LAAAKLVPATAPFGLYNGLACKIITTVRDPHKQVFLCRKGMSSLGAVGDMYRELQKKVGDEYFEEHIAERDRFQTQSYEGWRAGIWEPTKTPDFEIYVKMITQNRVYIDNNNGRYYRLNYKMSEFINSPMLMIAEIPLIAINEEHGYEF